MQISSDVIGLKKFLSQAHKYQKDWTGFFKTLSQGDKSRHVVHLVRSRSELKTDEQRALNQCFMLYTFYISVIEMSWNRHPYVANLMVLARAFAVRAHIIYMDHKKASYKEAKFLLL